MKKVKNKIKIKKVFVVIILSCFSFSIISAEPLYIKGRIYDKNTGKAIKAATVAVLEVKKKTRTNAEGVYSLSISEPGFYTLIVIYGGSQRFKEKLELKSSLEKDISITLVKLYGGELTVIGERDIQKISRNT